MKYLRNVMLALVAFVFVACGSQSPSEVAKEFAQKFFDADAKGVLSMLEKSKDKYSERDITFIKQIYDAGLTGGIENIVIEEDTGKYQRNVEDKEKEARYKAIIHSKSGEKAEFTFFLIKENDRWFIEIWGK